MPIFSIWYLRKKSFGCHKPLNQSERGSLTIFIRGQYTVFFSLALPLSLPFPLPLPLSFPLSVSLVVTLSVWARLSGEMDAGLVVKAYPFSLAPGSPYDGPAHLSEAQGGTVEDRVLGVVLEAVVDNEAKIRLKGFKREVAMGLQLVPHGLEVHWSVNMVQVVWHLNRRG